MNNLFVNHKKKRFLQQIYVKNMKKNYKTKIGAFILSTFSFSAMAQVSSCSGVGYYSSGTANPLVNQVKTPSTTLGGFTLPNTNISNSLINKKIIGDFNGDGLDDILMVYPECTNSNCSTSNGNRLKMFISNGNGDFTNTWTSQLNFLQVQDPAAPSNFNTLATEDISNFQFIVGNFIGDNKDEILIYKKITNSSISTFFTLLSNLHSTVCVREFIKYYNAPYSTDPKIGLASLNGANYYAANLIGDQHDELFSLEPQTAGLPMKWFIQQITTSGILTTGLTGTFNFSNEELYFENFDLGSSYTEPITN